MKLSRLAILSVLILLPVAGSSQTVPNKEPQLTEEQKQKLVAEALAAEKRTFAVSQLISLADECELIARVALTSHSSKYCSQRVTRERPYRI
jgi:hypothetical protein